MHAVSQAALVGLGRISGSRSLVPADLVFSFFSQGRTPFGPLIYQLLHRNMKPVCVIFVFAERDVSHPLIYAPHQKFVS